jgi:hypothetical protein
MPDTCRDNVSVRVELHLLRKLLLPQPAALPAHQHRRISRSGDAVDPNLPIDLYLGRRTLCERRLLFATGPFDMTNLFAGWVSDGRASARITWSKGLVRLAIEERDRGLRLVCRFILRRFLGRRELLPFGVPPLRRSSEFPSISELREHY